MKSKVRNWVLGSSFHYASNSNSQGTKEPYGPKFFNLLQVLSDEQYDEHWYIDSGCSCHMTGRKENLRDYRSLENVGVVKFVNNNKCKVKWYWKVMNGKFMVNRVSYVEGLQHNLISVL